MEETSKRLSFSRPLCAMSAPTYLAAVLTLIGSAACTGVIGDDGRNAGRTPNVSSSSKDSGLPPGADPGSILNCDPSTTPATLQRLVRLTAAQYTNTVSALLIGRPAPGGVVAPTSDTPSPPFQFVNPADRFETYSANYGMTDDEFRLAVDSAGAVSAKLVDTMSKGAGACIGDNKVTLADCLKPLLADKGAILFRRPLTDAESAKYSKIATDNAVALGSRQEATALAFQAMMSAPQFVFRVELGAESTEPAGRRRLTPYEVAAAISYSFTDAPADDVLWKAAQGDQLTTSEQIQEQVVRLLGTVPEQPSVNRFFEQYFHYPRAIVSAKDPQKYPDYHADLLVDDTARFVKDVLGRSGTSTFFRTLLSDANVIVRCETASTLGLSTAMNCMPHREMAPTGQRAGILTQPSFLAAYSAADDNKPVQRGRFVRESLLCGNVPPIPIAKIPPLKDLGPNATLREQLAEHSRGSCLGCHSLMDPLGLTFEQFDHTGKYRTKINDRDVDASGSIVGSGNQDGPVANAIELSNKLSGSSVAEQCFVRHSFRYWLGRKDDDTDACSITGAQDAYVKSGGNYVEMLKQLFTSDAFLYRKEQ